MASLPSNACYYFMALVLEDDTVSFIEVVVVFNN